MLIEAKVDLNIKDEDDLTPFQLGLISRLPKF
jgi:hypothetical protein